MTKIFYRYDIVLFYLITRFKSNVEFYSTCLASIPGCQCDRVVCYGERKRIAQLYAEYTSVTGGHILGSSSSVSESSSAEKSIAGLLSNADEQLRRAREYNNRMAQKMYTHTHQTQFTHTNRLAHTQRKLVNTTHYRLLYQLSTNTLDTAAAAAAAAVHCCHSLTAVSDVL